MVLLGLYAAVFGTRMLLKRLNLSHLRAHGQEIPPEFEGSVQRDVLEKTCRYVVENGRVDTWSSVLDATVTLSFLFGGILPVYDRWVGSVSESFYARGVLFFLGLLYAGFLLDVPFSMYRNFVIEKKYGFNTMTVRVWFSDLVKTLFLSTLIGGLVILGALALVSWSPERWWVWVWGFFLAVTVFLTYISPYVIEPLFFRFTPLQADGLEERIRAVLERAGLHVSRVFQVDASKRSRHSNAYFTGIGRVKRIVLFDTLVEQMNQDETVAVLAHEAGHWKKHHVFKRLLVTEVLSLVFLYLAYRLLKWEGLPMMVGLRDVSFFGRTVILGVVGSLALFPVTPLSSWFSRRHEREADAFARDLTGQPGALSSALVKLSVENLSNLHPHPVYAWFHYSHPPVLERVRALAAGEPADGGVAGV